MKFIKYIKEVNRYTYTLICFGVLFIISQSYGLFATEEEVNTSVNAIRELNIPFLELLIVGVLVPIIETFLYQFLIFRIINALFRGRKIGIYIAIIVSTLAFGFSHFYDIGYLVVGSLAGLLLITVYYFTAYIRKENGFIIVCIIHCLSNILATLLENVG